MSEMAMFRQLTFESLERHSQLDATTCSAYTAIRMIVRVPKGSRNSFWLPEMPTLVPVGRWSGECNRAN